MSQTHPQDDLLIILGLFLITELSTHDTISEHSWSIATELADQHGLEPFDALQNIAYFDPSESR